MKERKANEEKAEKSLQMTVADKEDAARSSKKKEETTLSQIASRESSGEEKAEADSES